MAGMLEAAAIVSTQPDKAHMALKKIASRWPTNTPKGIPGGCGGEESR